MSRKENMNNNEKKIHLTKKVEEVTEMLKLADKYIK